MMDHNLIAIREGLTASWYADKFSWSITLRGLDDNGDRIDLTLQGSLAVRLTELIKTAEAYYLSVQDPEVER